MSSVYLPYVCGLSLSTEAVAINLTFKFSVQNSSSLFQTSPNSLARD